MAEKTSVNTNEVLKLFDEVLEVNKTVEAVNERIAAIVKKLSVNRFIVEIEVASESGPEKLIQTIKESLGVSLTTKDIRVIHASSNYLPDDASNQKFHLVDKTLLDEPKFLLKTIHLETLQTES